MIVIMAVINCSGTKKRVSDDIVCGAGGWVVGGLDSENPFLTLVCRDVKSVVVSLNYRHAPEHPHPAAVDDVVDGLGWIARFGNKELAVDTSRIVLGGLSA